MKVGPAFQFYAGDALSDEGWIKMSFEARGVFVTLLCHQWIEGSIPADERELARLLHLDVRKFRRLWTEVGEKFERLLIEVGETSTQLRSEVDETSTRSRAEVDEKSARLVNDKLAGMRKSDAEFRASKSEAGKKGNDAKKGLTSDSSPKPKEGKRGECDNSATAEPHAERPLSDRPSPSSSYSSSVPPKAPQGGPGDRSAQNSEGSTLSDEQAEQLEKLQTFAGQQKFTPPRFVVHTRLRNFAAAGGTQEDMDALWREAQRRHALPKDHKMHVRSINGWVMKLLEGQDRWRPALLHLADSIAHSIALKKQKTAAAANHDPDYGDTAPSTQKATA